MRCSEYSWAYVFEVPEGHKLDNVTKHRFPLGGPQDAVIAVQHLHITEVRVAHSHDDDRHGQVGGMDDGLPGVSHVRDDTIGENQQDEILLHWGHQQEGDGEMERQEQWVRGLLSQPL